ncbi:putative phage tail protein [Clostridium sp.]|uniref:putative phage tail protein n=1 Tax=Clostridium sp. TaxID=1506 RepID=UPI00284FE270|nr:putative phage tail protein [Clostridium sp.]MDR3595092.1 DUF2313 domain-containing protein [Clostridium sp.]
MSYSDTLKAYFPPIVTDSAINSEILDSCGSEFDNLYNQMADLQLQFDVDTATWALDYYEKDLGIVTDYTKDYDTRRSVIKSKGRINGKLTSTAIKIVCDAFTNGDVAVTYDGTIHVKFTSVTGIPSNMDDLKNAVNQIKPAYILLDYLFSYLLINEIDGVMTINQLQATPLNKFAGGE